MVFGISLVTYSDLSWGNLGILCTVRCGIPSGIISSFISFASIIYDSDERPVLFLRIQILMKVETGKFATRLGNNCFPIMRLHAVVQQTHRRT